MIVRIIIKDHQSLEIYHLPDTDRRDKAKEIAAKIEELGGWCTVLETKQEAKDG